MSEWIDNSDQEPGIGRIEANPNTNQDGLYEKKEATLWNRFWGWFSPKLERGASLADSYGDSEVAQKNADVKRTLEEAGNIAAEREIKEAQAGTQRQLEVTQFIENIKSIESLESPAAQYLSFAKLMENNPELAAQLDKVQEMVSSLNLNKGTTISSTPQELEPALNINLKDTDE